MFRNGKISSHITPLNHEHYPGDPNEGIFHREWGNRDGSWFDISSSACQASEPHEPLIIYWHGLNISPLPAQWGTRATHQLLLISMSWFLSQSTLEDFLWFLWFDLKLQHMDAYESPARNNVVGLKRLSYLTIESHSMFSVYTKSQDVTMMDIHV